MRLTTCGTSRPRIHAGDNSLELVGADESPIEFRGDFQIEVAAFVDLVSQCLRDSEFCWSLELSMTL
jgi:hypothetical protein